MIQEIISPKPKHIQVADIVREQVMSGNLAKGSRLLPDGELARKYKVNRHTVAAGLNILAKEGLLERAPRRGTVITHSILTKNTGNAVGMVMMSKGEIYNDIVRSMTGNLINCGLYPVLIHDEFIHEGSQVISFMKSLISEKTAPYGFLIDGDNEFPIDFMIENLGKFRNTVFINKFRHKERIGSAKYVLSDLVEAGRMVAKHFIGKGHKRLAFLSIPQKDYSGPWSSIQVPIMEGFAEVCRASGMEFSDEIFWKLLHGAPFAPTVKTMLEKKRPTAIFMYIDYFLRYSLLPVLEAMGLKSMKDIELIGFYNTHHAEECGFSSISVREKEIAKKAIKMLTGEIEEQEILIKPELVVRLMA